MTRISQLINRVGTRRLLIILALLLFVLNLFRFAIGRYNDRQAEISSKVDLLQQYQMSTKKLAETRNTVSRLERQKERLDTFLITGKSEEEIESRLQIRLQEQIAKAGLAVESLRPVSRSDKTKEKDKDKDYGEIVIKMRLTGTLNGFIDLLASFYKSKSLFKIESFTLKPFKKKGLKIFLDYKGYYKLLS